MRSWFYASTWRFRDQDLPRYEFVHAGGDVSLHRHPMQSFLLELGAIVEKRKRVSVLGICSLSEKFIDRPTTMEFTGGPANITLRFEIALCYSNFIDAMWQFSSDPLSSSVQVDQRLRSAKIPIASLILPALNDSILR